MSAAIKHGDSRRQSGARWAFAVAKDRYGPQGRRPEAEARRVAGLARGAKHHNLQKRACPKGHRYTPENTHVYENRRYCKACNTLRRHQRRWRRLVESRRLAEVERLWRKMLSAHPDRGGTTETFVRARERWQAAKRKVAESSPT